MVIRRRPKAQRPRQAETPSHTRNPPPSTSSRSFTSKLSFWPVGRIIRDVFAPIRASAEYRVCSSSIRSPLRTNLPRRPTFALAPAAPPPPPLEEEGAPPVVRQGSTLQRSAAPKCTLEERRGGETSDVNKELIDGCRSGGWEGRGG